MYYRTFWWNVSSEHIHPKKQYVLLFNTFNETKRLSYSMTEYDKLVDAYEEINGLDELYKNHELPIKVKITRDVLYGRKIKSKTKFGYDFRKNRSWWGYILLDMKECKCIRVGGNGFLFCNVYCKTEPTIIKNTHGINGVLRVKDYLFRDENVVPDDYVWDGIGEYEGWLQYKWGDGKNAIDYVKPAKNKKKDFQEMVLDIENNFSGDLPMPDNYKWVLENKFEYMINKETKSRLMLKYGW